MAILLQAIVNKLDGRLNILESAFQRHVVAKRLDQRIDIIALREGLVSALWQTWCHFCREVTISSAVGAETISGTQTTSQFAALPVDELLYVAAQSAKQQSYARPRPLGGAHLEPTWGAHDKINRIVYALCPTNQNSLASAFGGMSSINDLQTCRNANAHISSTTIGAVKSCRSRYNKSIFKHPADMTMWIDPTSKDFLCNTWIEEMRLIAMLAAY